MGEERRVTAGGRSLRAHIDRMGISVPDWCEKHDIDRIQVQRLLNGDRYKRVSVDMATSIVAAAHKDDPSTALCVEMFRSQTAKAPRPKAA